MISAISCSSNVWTLGSGFAWLCLTQKWAVAPRALSLVTTPKFGKVSPARWKTQPVLLPSTSTKNRFNFKLQPFSWFTFPVIMGNPGQTYKFTEVQDWQGWCLLQCWAWESFHIWCFLSLGAGLLCLRLVALENLRWRKSNDFYQRLNDYGIILYYFGHCHHVKILNMWESGKQSLADELQ